MSKRVNPFQEALDVVEGASNSLGITKSFATALDALVEDYRDRGVSWSTGMINRSPVAILFLEQLCSLARISPVHVPGGFTKAYHDCKELAKEWAQHYDALALAESEGSVSPLAQLTETDSDARD